MHPKSIPFYALLPLIILLGACASQDKPPGLSASENEPDLPRLGAVGIGVRDLAVSSEFYQQILDLEVLRTYELGYINEIVLGHANAPGAVLVLMNWPNQQRSYAGGDVKNVFYVDDPKAVIDRMRALGGTIDRDAKPHPALNGRLVGLGRDPDNYVVEVIQRNP